MIRGRRRRGRQIAEPQNPFFERGSVSRRVLDGPAANDVLGGAEEATFPFERPLRPTIAQLTRDRYGVERSVVSARVEEQGGSTPWDYDPFARRY